MLVLVLRFITKWITFEVHIHFSHDRASEPPREAGRGSGH